MSKRQMIVVLILIIALAVLLRVVPHLVRATRVSRKKLRVRHEPPPTHTRRLGNIIDSWFFGSLGSQERIMTFKQLQKEVEERSFGRTFELTDSLARNVSPDTLKTIIQASQRDWATYHYDSFIPCLDLFRASLSQRVDTFFSGYDPPETYDCVVHYRAGDFLNAEYGVIHPDDVAHACASALRSRGALKPSLRSVTVGIANGGINHHTWQMSHLSKEEVHHRSRYLHEQLVRKLKEIYRDRDLVCHFFSFSSDVDFFICARARLLVIGGGSFAVCAAIANKRAHVILSPACSDLSRAVRGPLSGDISIAPNWSTYPFSSDKVVVLRS